MEGDEQKKNLHQNLYFPSTLKKRGFIKISTTGINQKPKYNCSKFSQPFTKLQPKDFQRLYSPSFGRQAYSKFDSFHDGVRGHIQTICEKINVIMTLIPHPPS